MSADSGGSPGSNLLAFVHIEKAAGTTLLYLLRRNCLFRYADVRPLRADSNGVFTAADLARYLRLNPFLRAIGGHAVKPFGDLDLLVPGIRYITLLRDPVKRYLSQFRYWNRVLGKGWDFERFLRHAPSHDFQTKKIAGSADLGLATEVLAERCFMVGLVEHFEEFLVLLSARLRPEVFDPRFRSRNVGRADQHVADELGERYADDILANNSLDVELCEFVRREIVPRDRERYQGDLKRAVDALTAHAAGSRSVDLRLALDGITRKLYYEPVTGLMRRSKGMPMRGSY